MLPNGCIEKLLDMEHLEGKNVERSPNQIVLHVQMKRRICSCPACRAGTEPKDKPILDILSTRYSSQVSDCYMNFPTPSR